MVERCSQLKIQLDIHVGDRVTGGKGELLNGKQNLKQTHSLFFS
jgi:hypothetical protein